MGREYWAVEEEEEEEEEESSNLFQASLTLARIRHKKQDTGEREEEFKAPRHDVLILHRIIRKGFEKKTVLMREKKYIHLTNCTPKLTQIVCFHFTVFVLIKSNSP